MQQRKVGDFTVSAIGLGCMNVVHGYTSRAEPEAAMALFHRALDLGCTHLDTAAIYGLGRSEELLGASVMGRRSEFMLASKCGLVVREDGTRGIDGTPRGIRKVCDDSLRRLKTDVIDLYYLHRLDRNVPVEESVGALGELVAAGKIRAVGLSEVSGATLRRAHREFPIAAVQNEYSLWTRNPEIDLMEACRETGATLVAFSPLARAFLTGRLRDLSTLKPGDMRLAMPRFEPENFRRNLALLDGYGEIAREIGCTPAQLALAWVLARGEDVVAIPGTASMTHLEENMEAGEVVLTASQIERLDALINERTVAGARYGAAMQADVDTEDFPDEETAG